MTNIRFRTVLGAATILAFAASAFAQTGFSPGNIVVSRSTYQGTAATVTAGQFLPPICPSTGSCSSNGGAAVSNGAYPTIGSSSNVWNNDGPDGSFGITSPIFLDQYTPAGTLVNTLA